MVKSSECESVSLETLATLTRAWKKLVAESITNLVTQHRHQSYEDKYDIDHQAWKTSEFRGEHY